MQEMGFGVPEWGSGCLDKRKFRWVFSIPDVAGSAGGLPCQRGARPSFSFREIEIQHVNEIIYYPGKPEWKTLQLTLFDVAQNSTGYQHPIMQWIEGAYDPIASTGDWMPSFNSNFRKQIGTLSMLSGCGTIVETWSFDGLWPQAADFGELDMSNMEIATCEVTLRYDRAY